MALTEILVHVDESPAAETRLKAAVELAAAAQAHVSALFLVTEPFMRALVGRHLPEEFVRQHLATLEREADARLEGLGAIAAGRSIGLETRRETAALDRLPAILARQGRRADQIVVGPGVYNSQEALTEAALMDTGRRWSCRRTGPAPCRRDGRWSRGMARARPPAPPSRCCGRPRT